MARNRARIGTRSTGPPAQGITAGYLLRQIRDGIGYTQEALAEQLDVDPNTYRGWETGRRSLGQVKSATLRVIMRKLRILGASPQLLDRMDTAVDVDVFIGEALDGDTHPTDHPLAGWVSTRDWNDMLGWSISGPSDGGMIPRPRLAAPDRCRFFDNLRTAAERADDEAGLLRRQVYFVAARDDSPTGRDWLAAVQRRESRHLRRGDGWTPGWVTARSLAVARACQGDPEPLRDFITHRIDGDDLCEAANINYWAYWVGENATQAVSDGFMATDLGRWRGSTLLNHLVDGLHGSTPYLDLSIHTVWALLDRRPYLVHDDPELIERLEQSIRTLLDQPPPHLGTQARRELGQLHFATRMHTAKGPR